ncbi:MAG: hypothetical protein K6G23_00630 [Lachnospiraceae bacterium]|nr:hypothetical protein [Lachnospiraceae bacterium]
MDTVFKEEYLAGRCEFEAIDDYIDYWMAHEENPQRLAEFLGFSGQEEDVWVSESDEALKELLDQQKA